MTLYTCTERQSYIQLLIRKLNVALRTFYVTKFLLAVCHHITTELKNSVSFNATKQICKNFYYYVFAFIPMCKSEF